MALPSLLNHPKWVTGCRHTTSRKRPPSLRERHVPPRAPSQSSFERVKDFVICRHDPYPLSPSGAPSRDGAKTSPSSNKTRPLPGLPQSHETPTTTSGSQSFCFPSYSSPVPLTTVSFMCCVPSRERFRRPNPVTPSPMQHVHHDAVLTVKGNTLSPMGNQDLMSGCVHFFVRSQLRRNLHYGADRTW